MTNEALMRSWLVDWSTTACVAYMRTWGADKQEPNTPRRADVVWRSYSAQLYSVSAPCAKIYTVNWGDGGNCSGG